MRPAISEYKVAVQWSIIVQGTGGSFHNRGLSVILDGILAKGFIQCITDVSAQ